jgi:hypothetical protein
MKIELTKDQYEALLKMVYLGNWMASSALDEPDKDMEGFEQYVLSLAKKFGYETYAGFDEEAKAFFPSEEFEDKSGVVDIIGDYNMRTVWEEMVLSLARRDLVAGHGEEAVSGMSEEEMMEKELPLILKYEEEFRERGFENLFLTGKE